MRCPLPTSSWLREFAEAPAAFLPASGARVVETDRYYALAASNGRYVDVSRVRLEPAEAYDVVAEVQAIQPGARASWTLVAPADHVVAALKDAGCRDPDPPLVPTFTALVTEHELPAAPEIEVRRVQSFEDFLVGLEIVLAEDWSDDQRARRRAEAEETYVRRRSRPGGEWLAYVDGRPAAWAGAVACERGLFLAGAATLAEYRGRGCYRALLRERWDEAVRLGAPALVVHAQETSRPILERCGFERVCTMHELASGPR
jgi:GNAT superfamily N-acetyltransferase